MKIPPPDFEITPYGDVDAAALEKLRQSFDTARLLELVEQLMPIMQRLGKTDGVRDDLLRLHRMAHTIINGAGMCEPTTEDVWELAASLIDEFQAMADSCLEIASALQPLAELRHVTTDK